MVNMFIRIVAANFTGSVFARITILVGPFLYNTSPKKNL